MSSANSSLRPAWRNSSGGKGFQPPPSVNSGKGRSSSIGSSTEGSEKSEGRIYNKFSALDDDDDFEVVGGPPAKSRLEGLRQGLAVRSASSGTKPGGSGRSLADLAATVPEKAPTSSSNRFARDENVIRFTREKLLSMRPQPKGEVPEVLRELEGTVVLADKAQDPVCFDVFDADSIWATVPARRSSSVKLTRETSQGEAEPRRPSARISGTGGRWQRGVALPPPSATTSSTGRTKEIIADNPEDLWDDPVAASGAAADFSAFGDLGDSERDSAAGDAFDFEKMAEESRLLETELHPHNETSTEKGSANGLPRPLSVVGTTILSGSGDDVNVFEDFDDPAAEPATPPTETTTPESTQEAAPVKSATEDPTASSRLMAMIGVNPDRSSETEGLSLAALVGGGMTSEALAPVETPTPGAPAALTQGWGGSAEPEPANGLNIPLNPWGGSSLLGAPAVPTSTIPAPSAHDLDLQARLREAEMEQKAREQLRRQQEMEAQKRAQLQQEQQRQDAQRQQGVQSQVELVLMERIATILERSWGRSDLISILTALHAEDPRVVPLLNNVDALRALLIRNSSRVRVQHDPAFGTEVAVLVVTNSQWQEQQAARAQQEEMRRRMQRQEEQQKQQAQRQREESAARSRRNFRPDAPWFYSDPQGNIQGPFRSEEMRQWLMAGYFKGDLPVCQDPNGPFLALSSVFPDLNNAFVFSGDLPPQQQSSPQADDRRAEEEAQARRTTQQKEQEARERAAIEAAEQERVKRQAEEQEKERLRRASAEEAERKAQAEKLAAERKAQAQRQMQESAAAKSSKANSSGNESSAQLKMMLGLGGGGNAGSNGAGVPATPTPTPVAPRKVVETKAEQPKRQSKSGVPPAPPIESQPSPPKPAAPTASPWGSASQPSRKKTMEEIQKEEARAATLAAMRQENARPSGSGWANVAASKGGTSGWNSGAVRAAPAAVLTRPQVAQPTAPSPLSAGGKNVVDVAALNMQTAPPPPQGKGGKNSPADAFGAKMSPPLEKWCKEQMMKLNGTDDLTLVSFCMTLNDPSEIRQYLTAYLGTGSQVNNFATEFINRKVGVTPARDEWESTVTTKKKSKKKTAK
mmetsp:Transcript_9381/g.17885  ORF Transcript_9381/g.17885 Transcript_9381/m.17885 type:complete len:1095 (+) Transcript_9381:153-3437(+)